MGCFDDPALIRSCGAGVLFCCGGLFDWLRSDVSEANVFVTLSTSAFESPERFLRSERVVDLLYVTDFTLFDPLGGRPFLTTYSLRGVV